jgi:hypothetical protein
MVESEVHAVLAQLVRPTRTFCATEKLYAPKLVPVMVIILSPPPCVCRVRACVCVCVCACVRACVRERERERERERDVTYSGMHSMLTCLSCAFLPLSFTTIMCLVHHVKTHPDSCDMYQISIVRNLPLSLSLSLARSLARSLAPFYEHHRRNLCLCKPASSDDDGSESGSQLVKTKT